MLLESTFRIQILRPHTSASHQECWKLCFVLFSPEDLDAVDLDEIFQNSASGLLTITVNIIFRNYYKAVSPQN